jgi:hypothetical protein
MSDNNISKKYIDVQIEVASSGYKNPEDKPTATQFFVHGVL